LHVGGARTAYFNWLFARQHGGALVLRIEDTDVERSSAESEGGVLDDLRWLGLDWDEGPDRGGPLGPYRQSERLPLYRERADQLVRQGAAYPCFCTDAELETRRRQALAAGRPPHYDGRCRGLTPAEQEARRAEGCPESIRFAVRPGDQSLDDLVRGPVRFPGGMVGDFVLLRASGLPTYNFACVVDDAGMRISHVIRAEEHLSNTPRQLMLYHALAETAPRFAHVPLILNRDRSKMSKRSGETAVAVGDWRRAGYLPEALLSYLALLGFHPGDDREVLSRDDLLAVFSLGRVGKSGSVFDGDKLRWMNAHYLHHADGPRLFEWGGPFMPDAALRRGRQQVERLLEGVRGNLTTLADIPGELAPFVEDAPRFDAEAEAVLADPRAREVCRELWSVVNDTALEEWSGEVFKSAVQRVGRQLGRKGRELYQPVRVALTGRTHGPELPLIADLLGHFQCETRLQAAAFRASEDRTS
jgi:nondiscriminating glutamyl-tRNA synthetase